MAVRDDRGDVKQTTTGFRGPLMVQSLTSAKSKFLSLTSAKSKFLSLVSDSYCELTNCCSLKERVTEDAAFICLCSV